MKIAALVLILALPMAAADRFMDIVHLTEASSKDVKGGRLKLIAVRGAKADYVLTCNEDNIGCRTPEVGEVLDLVKPHEGPYECENVALAIQRASSYRGFYCLWSTSPR